MRDRVDVERWRALRSFIGQKLSSGARSGTAGSGRLRSFKSCVNAQFD